MKWKWTYMALVVLFSISNAAIGQTSSRFSLTKTGGLLVDKKPFFPIWVWAQPSGLIEENAKLGINTFSMGQSAADDPVKPYLDKLHKRGLFATPNAEMYDASLKNHPAVIAWIVEHEADQAVRSEFAIDPGKKGILLEGESAVKNTLNADGWLNHPSGKLSGGKWLGTRNLNGEASWTIDVAKERNAHLWVREFTKDWANPTTWKLNEGPWKTTPRDIPTHGRIDLGNGRGVCWVYYGPVMLKKGKNTLSLKPSKGRTTGRKVANDDVLWAVDAICLSETKASPPVSQEGSWVPVRGIAKQKANFGKIKAAMPDALTLYVFTPDFYETYWKEKPVSERYHNDILRYTDIATFDHYPVTGWNCPQRLPEVGLATKRLLTMAEKIKANKPVWTIIEASDQDMSHTAPETRGPNPQEMRSSAYMAVANGAKGLGYFTVAFNPFRWSHITPEIKAEMKRTNAELTELTSPIVIGDTAKGLKITNNKTDDKSAKGAAVQAIRKEYQGKTYVIAVNVTRKAAMPTFTLLEPPSVKIIEVWKEGRTLPIQNGTFQDTFKPLQVHVYTIK